MKKTKRETGCLGEDFAASYLSENGYEILCRNFTVRGGELDIIAKKSDILVFAEVKLRGENSLSKPCEAVDKHKIDRLVHTAEAYLYKNRDDKKLNNLKIRFDVIEIYANKDTIYNLNHIENIDVN